MFKKVSCIIPVYNTHPAFLTRCFDSVINQSLNKVEYEVIIGDDGSTIYETIYVLNYYAEKYHKLFKLLKLEGKRSPANGRNAGLDIATGEYIYFLDSDDYVNTETFERAYNFSHENDTDITIGRVASENGVTRKKPYLTGKNILQAHLFGHKIYVTGAVNHRLVRREFIGDLRLPMLAYRQDAPFMGKLYLRAKKISVCDDGEFIFGFYCNNVPEQTSILIPPSTIHILDVTQLSAPSKYATHASHINSMSISTYYFSVLYYVLSIYNDNADVSEHFKAKLIGKWISNELYIRFRSIKVISQIEVKKLILYFLRFKILFKFYLPAIAEQYINKDARNLFNAIAYGDIFSLISFICISQIIKKYKKLNIEFFSMKRIFSDVQGNKEKFVNFDQDTLDDMKERLEAYGLNVDYKTLNLPEFNTNVYALHEKMAEKLIEINECLLPLEESTAATKQ